MKRVAGYTSFVFSFVTLVLIALLPFSGLGAGPAPVAAGALFITGEIAFWLLLLLLGKEFWTRIKSWFSLKFTNKD